MTEPYAWVDGNSRIQSRQIDPLVDIPLYKKQEWQGLTGEELRNIAREFKGNTKRRFEDHWDEIVAFVREAEAKLKEKNGG